MKKKSILFTILIAISLVITAIVVSCENENPEENTPEKIQLKEFVSSGCKGTTERNAKNSEKTLVTEYIAYKALENGYLQIKHINTKFNCCSDTIITNVSDANNEIKITENEKGPKCKCLCNYDLEYKIGPLLFEKYEIIIHKNDNSYAKFTINYNSSLEGKITIK